MPREMSEKWRRVRDPGGADGCGVGTGGGEQKWRPGSAENGCAGLQLKAAEGAGLGIQECSKVRLREQRCDLGVQGWKGLVTSGCRAGGADKSDGGYRIWGSGNTRK